MFKKKRSALLEEMRQIAEVETVRVLEAAGLISEHVRVIGVSGVRSSYVAKPAEDRAAKAIAEEAKAAAAEALEVAENARMEAQCGCRCNSANDTRVGSPVSSLADTLARTRVMLLDGVENHCDTAPVAPEAARATAQESGVAEAGAGAAGKGSMSGARGAAQVPTGQVTSDMIYPVATVELLVAALDLVSDNINKGVKCRKRRADGVGVGGDSLTDVHPWGLAQEHGASDLEMLALRISDVLLNAVDLCHQIGVHSSSPVVAESEAGTSDAPAMTVQEGGSSDAAPGVEGVSPASSTPRFVAVGDCVYDRMRNLVARFSMAGNAAEAARRLNDDQDLEFYWEDAK